MNFGPCDVLATIEYAVRWIGLTVIAVAFLKYFFGLFHPRDHAQVSRENADT